MSKISIKDGGVVEALRSKSQKALRQNIDLLLQKEGQAALARMSLRVTKGGAKGSKELRARTGVLRASLGYATSREEQKAALELGTMKLGGPNAKALAYAAIHEYGGTITKGPGFLTIPLKAALTPSGVAKFSARDTAQRGRVPGLSSTFFQGDNKRLILFGIFGAPRNTPVAKRWNSTSIMRNAKNGSVVRAAETRRTKPKSLRDAISKRALNKGEPVPLFLLVHKVVIPKRPYVGPEREMAFKNIREKLPRVLADSIKTSGGRNG